LYALFSIFVVRGVVRVGAEVMNSPSAFAPSVQHTKVCIGPKDRYYQVILERCIEMGYLETGEAEVYKDGDLYIVDWLMSLELNRAAMLYMSSMNEL
jgi:hypothetical protein